MSAAPEAGVKIEPEQTHLVGEFKHTSPLLACRFDPSGQFVFASAQDRTIQRWHIASGKATPLVGHESWVRSALAFHPSGSTLYSGGYDGRVIFWDVSSEAPQQQRTFEAHQGWVRAVAVSPDGYLLATCGNDHRVKLWNTADGAQVQECIGHEFHVYNVAFHPQTSRLVSGDLKGGVREWDVGSGEQLRDLDASALWKYDPSFHADMGGVRAISFSPDGKLLACAGVCEITNAFGGLFNPLVVVFDFATGEKLQQLVTKAKLKGSGNGVRCHRDGFVIGASGGVDGGHLLFWRVDQPNEFFDFKMPDVARDLDLHPDQMRLATSHEDGTLRLWQMTAKAKQRQSQMPTLIAIILLPLAIIGLQIVCGASGAVGNSFYKLAFIVAPLVYCRANRIHVGRQIFKWQNWRHDLRLALILGAAAAGIFVGVYAAFGDLLLDKEIIVSKIHAQFSVDAGTVLLIAPFTIATNALIEEFFYRGFAFGQLAQRNAVLGTLLPAGAFTAQHLLFIHHWVTPLPLVLAIVGLAVFALVLQAVYAKADSLVAPWVIHVCGDLAMIGIAVHLVW